MPAMSISSTDLICCQESVALIVLTRVHDTWELILQAVWPTRNPDFKLGTSFLIMNVMGKGHTLTRCYGNGPNMKRTRSVRPLWT